MTFSDYSKFKDHLKVIYLAIEEKSVDEISKELGFSRSYTIRLLYMIRHIFETRQYLTEKTKETLTDTEEKILHLLLRGVERSIISKRLRLSKEDADIIFSKLSVIFTSVIEEYKKRPYVILEGSFLE